MECTPEEKQEAILDAADLPRLEQPYPGLEQVRCLNVSPQRIGPTYFHVPVVWEGEIGPAGPDDSPLNEPAKYTWSSRSTTEEIDSDIHGNPIVTANGEPIHGVTDDIPDLQVNVEKNYRTVSLKDTHIYLRSVNSDWINTPYGNFDPGLGRLTKFQATEKFTQSIGGYVKVRATVLFRYPYNVAPAEAWHARVRHEGFKVKGGDGKIKRAIDPKTKQESNTPVLLKPDGTLQPNPDNAHWLLWARKFPLPYANLDLF